MKARLLGSLFIFLLSFHLSQSEALTQEAVPAAPAATVPDLTGLNIPQAAAALNRAGIALGSEQATVWLPESTIPVDTVSGQSIPAGTAVTPGAAVDVTVLRAPNVTLIYDDNDLTFINHSDARIDFADIGFNALQTPTPVSFHAARWAGGIDGRGCAQLWSINRGTAKDVAGCSQIDRWLTTGNRTEHFWMMTSGTQAFTVMQADVQRGVCEAAAPGSEAQPKTCNLYLEAAGSSQGAGFIYFAYTQNQFLIINSTDNNWMRLNNSILHIKNPADGVTPASFNLGDPVTFGNPQIVAKIQRLAPGQCLLYIRAGTQDSTLPQDCFVIAQRTFEAQVFWDFDFELQGVSDGRRRLCTAAVPNKLTLCILPR